MAPINENDTLMVMRIKKGYLKAGSVAFHAAAILKITLPKFKLSLSDANLLTCLSDSIGIV